jgi:hypothetical protein
MKHSILLAISLLAILLTGCSESTDSQSTAPVSQQQSAAPAPPAMPAGHPGAQATPQAGQQQLSSTQKAALNAAKGLPKQGRVLEMMHAAGYTYMNVDVGSGKPVWIAATMMRIKPQQIIKWDNAAVMRNFNSKTLHRTFDEIQFVSNAAVVH